MSQRADGDKMKNWNKKALFVDFLGIVMGRAAFFSMNPIAMGYFLYVYGQDTNKGVLIGTLLLGMMTKMDGVSVIKYGLIMLALSVIRHLLKQGNREISDHLWGLIGGSVTAALSITKAFLYADYIQYVALALLEGVLVYVSCALLQKGTAYILYGRKKEPMNNEEMISVGILLAIGIYTMPEFALIPLSLAQIVAYLVVIFMGYKYGPGVGAVIGAICGMVISYSSQSVTFIGILCILGIGSGMFQEIGKLGAGIAYIITGISLGYLYEHSLLKMQGLESLFLAVLVFWLVPTGWIQPVTWERQKSGDYVKQNLQILTKNKFQDFSASLEKLSRSFLNYTDKRQILGCDDMNGIFEDISGKFCKDCSQCDRCWNHNYQLTYELAQDMFAIAKRNGYLKSQDIPLAFKDQCMYADSFIKETNKRLEIATLNLKWYNKLMESRQAVAGQLGEMAETIKLFASDITEMKEVRNYLEEKMTARLKIHQIQVNSLVILENKEERLEVHVLAKTRKGRCITTREMATILSKAGDRRFRPSEQSRNIVPKEFAPLIFLEDTKYKVLTGIARATKKGEEISGDNFSFLELDSGEMVMTLCDGMGSGEEAHAESKSVIDLIEDFMEAGFKEASAIHLINSLYVLEADGRSFSTIDMGIVDLFTGNCNFVKMGAAATFLKRAQGVEVITSYSLPAGIFEDAEYEGARRRIGDGEFIIMMTDGVLDCFAGEDKEGAMRGVLEEIKSRNPREIANSILEEALMAAEAGGVEESAITDDMTVIVAGVWDKY